MSRRGPWAVAAIATLVVVLLPAAVGHLPVSDSTTSAADLLARVRASATVGYSGYAESRGTLGLPTGQAFPELTDLLGGRTRIRVWWRGPADWRIDALAAAGERGTYRDAGGTWKWDFEANRATQLDQPAYRPPNTADFVPADLGRRLLAQARPGELRRIPAARVAGRDAPGLRLRPAEADATVERVDAWVDPVSGLPLRVEAWGHHARQAALSTRFLDLTVARPSAALTRFVPARGADFTAARDYDLDAISREYADAPRPARLIGLPLRHDTAALGTYGRGPVLLAAVPLPDQLGQDLSFRLQSAPVTRVTKDGLALSAGPLSLLLTTTPGGIWLLTGTVTPAALQRAALELRRAADTSGRPAA